MPTKPPRGARIERVGSALKFYYCKKVHNQVTLFERAHSPPPSEIIGLNHSKGGSGLKKKKLDGLQKKLKVV